MLPEIKIILYIIFISSLFIFNSRNFYLLIAVLLFVLLLRVPFRIIKSGWIPISLFLIFTFLSNLPNQHGRILFSAGPVFITYEGFDLSVIRAMRLLFMIAGAKILFASAKPDEIVNALGRLFGPLEKLRLPVRDFFHTMGLTMKCFPVLKKMITDAYNEKIKKENITGFLNRARAVSGFLFPLVARSILSPEVFFENTTTDRKHD